MLKPRDRCSSVFIVHLFFFKVFPCSQGLLTNSIVGSMPCTKEGVQAGREFPIPPARFGTKVMLLLLFQLCLCQLYSGSLTHTCWPRLVPLCSSYSSNAPCTDTAFSSPTPPSSPSPRQGYTLHGPGSACASMPALLPNALMAEAVPPPPSATGSAPSLGPRLQPYRPPAPGPPSAAHPAWLTLPAHGDDPPGPAVLGGPPPGPGPHTGTGRAPHSQDAGPKPAREGRRSQGARGAPPGPGSVPSRSPSPLPAPGAPTRL